MSKSISLYFDFGSPTSYLAYNRLKQLRDAHGVDIDLRPVLLGGIFQGAGNNSPAAVPLKSRWMDIDMKRYARRYGVEFKHNPFFPINTMLLMRASLVALEIGCFDHYVETVFNAMWREPRNMADMDVIVAVLTDAGLNAARLLEGTQQPEIKEGLKNRTAEALELGLFGCPTMIFDNEFFFGQDRIFFIEEMIENEQLGRH